MRFGRSLEEGVKGETGVGEDEAGKKKKKEWGVWVVLGVRWKHWYDGVERNRWGS